MCALLVFHASCVECVAKDAEDTQCEKALLMTKKTLFDESNAFLNEDASNAQETQYLLDSGQSQLQAHHVVKEALNQGWGQIKGKNNMCLDWYYPWLWGDKVGLYPCHGGHNQKWMLSGDGRMMTLRKAPIFKEKGKTEEWHIHRYDHLCLSALKCFNKDVWNLIAVSCKTDGWFKPAEQDTFMRYMCDRDCETKCINDGDHGAHCHREQYKCRGCKNWRKRESWLKQCLLRFSKLSKRDQACFQVCDGKAHKNRLIQNWEDIQHARRDLQLST